MMSAAQNLDKDGFTVVLSGSDTDANAPKARTRAGEDKKYVFFIRHSNGDGWLLVKNLTFTPNDQLNAWTVVPNVTGSEYATVLSGTVNASLTDEFAPFVRPNQYVNFTADSKAVAKAAEICEGAADNLAKVEAVYSFVVNHLTYDKEKAQTVKSGYLPDVDASLSSGKGICFDYAALMAAMLRSQGVPVKLVVGYTGDAYHAWLNVWGEKEGWIEGKIYFDGKEWKLMDPTFASTGSQSEEIMKYIGDGTNYTAKYLY